MRRVAITIAIGAAFSAGFLMAKNMPTAAAADADAPVARIINLVKMTDEEIGAPRPGTDIRSRSLYASASATVAIQSGNVFKHFHQDSDEVQYVLDGSGTFWLGDTKREIGPGDLIIIPKGTVHAGSIATTGRFRVIAIKAPPQALEDTHVVN